MANEYRLYIWTSTGMQEPEDLEKARALGLRLYEVASPPTEGVVVTPAMIEAGKRQHFEDTAYHVPLDTWLERIYKAMIAAAPATSESAAVGALRELVRLEDIKKRIRNMDSVPRELSPAEHIRLEQLECEYDHGEPRAWEAARAALKDAD